MAYDTPLNELFSPPSLIISKDHFPKPAPTISLPLITYPQNPKLNSFYSPQRLDVTIDTGCETPTIQSAKDECDINNIIHNFQRTGIIEHLNANAAEFYDLPDDFTYENGVETLRKATDAFSALPSVLRDRFNNDPSEFLTALNDPSHTDFFVDLGILRRNSPAPVPPPDTEKP